MSILETGIAHHQPDSNSSILSHMVTPTNLTTPGSRWCLVCHGWFLPAPEPPEPAPAPDPAFVAQLAATTRNILLYGHELEGRTPPEPFVRGGCRLCNAPGPHSRGICADCLRRRVRELTEDEGWSQQEAIVLARAE